MLLLDYASKGLVRNWEAKNGMNLAFKIQDIDRHVALMCVKENYSTVISASLLFCVYHLEG